MFKITLAAFAAIIAILGLTWLGQGNEFFLAKVFAPKMEQVRRDTFEQSKAYRRGTVNDLQDLRVQWVKGDAETKTMIGSIILQRASDFPDDAMPSDLRSFIYSLKNPR